MAITFLDYSIEDASEFERNAVVDHLRNSDREEALEYLGLYRELAQRQILIEFLRLVFDDAHAVKAFIAKYQFLEEYPEDNLIKIVKFFSEDVGVDLGQLFKTTNIMNFKNASELRLLLHGKKDEGKN